MMAATPASNSRHRIAAVALVILIALVLLATRSLQSDFTGNPDEPSHVVSSLMVRDYVVDAFPGNPLTYAENYYMHYPKVAIVHWPPLFYCGEAGFMLVFGRNRTALLIFSAGILTLLVLSLFFWMRRECGLLPAFVAASLFVTSIHMVRMLSVVGPDGLMTLFLFWSVVNWGLFLETPRWRYLGLSLLFTVCAVGSHYRAILLILVFPIAVALARGGSLRHRRFFFVASIVLSVALLPMLAYVPHWLSQAYPFSWASLVDTVTAVAKTMLHSLGLPLILLAIVGIPLALRGRPRWSAMMALLFGGLLFLASVNVPFIERYMFGSMLPVIAAAAMGFAYLWRLLRRPIFQGALLTVLAAFIAYSLFNVERKHDRGYHRLVAAPALPGSDSLVYLSAGDPIDEGAFVSEMALQSAHPLHFVVRAGKVLAHSSWNGDGFRLLFDTPEAIRDQLNLMHVGFVVVEETSRKPEVPLLTQALRTAPTVWAQLTAPEAPIGVSVFRRIGPMPTGPMEIEVHTSMGQHLHIRQ